MIDRLIGILTVLLSKDRVTAPELAEKFEVSRRTIGRDVDALCMAGIPVVTYQGRGGGISVAKGFKLDKNILTKDELSVIIAQTGQQKEKIELIRQAVRREQLIEFDYYYEKGDSRRRIEPYFVIFQWTAWYVFGFCQTRQDFRLFKLTRLWNLRLCDERYAPREIPPEKKDFNMRNEGERKLVALFDPSVKYQLIEAYGLNCFEETKDGLVFEAGFTNGEYMIGWLLGFGDNVKVLEPKEIAEGVQSAAEKILFRYK